MSNKTTARKRNDYRTLKEGTVAHYLIHLYPLDMDFQRGLRGTYAQLHDTSTDHDGRFIALDGHGRPDLAKSFMRELVGVERWVFVQALEELRGMEGLAVPGRQLVAALEWYQGAKLNRARGLTRSRMAHHLGVDASTLSRWCAEAIDLIEALVFKPPSSEAQNPHKTCTK